MNIAGYFKSIFDDPRGTPYPQAEDYPKSRAKPRLAGVGVQPDSRSDKVGVTNDSEIQPVGFQIVIALDPTKEKTAGGLYLPETTKNADELAAEEGELIAVGAGAFDYINEWPNGTKPVVGQRVMFKRYDGLLRKRTINGVERAYRILEDKSVVAIVEPEGARADLGSLDLLPPMEQLCGGFQGRSLGTNGLREAAMDRVGEVEG
jgi:chaperonin GroES